MNSKAAEELARDALIFLSERPEEIGRLLVESGADVGELRARAEDPGFLGFVLDFVMSDEPLAEAFCLGGGLTAETLARARAALPGGDAPHWL